MKVISLFCGAGGLDLGFVKANHRIIWANDIDQDSVNTHNGYAPLRGHAICKEIQEIPTAEIPDTDIVIGGFPCEGFSVANLRRSTEDHRNKLYLEYLRVLTDKQPLLFIAENVPGIKSLAGGKVFDMILRDFDGAGYNVKHDILNAVDYGVPQSRRRVIILGVRKDIDITIQFPPVPTHAQEPGNNLFTQHLRRWKTVNEAIGDLPEPSDNCGIYNHEGTKHVVRINGYVGNRATRGDLPSPTIMGRGGGTGGPVIIPHPKLHRRLTPRECARLQDFPDDLIFCGSVSSQYRQIGNAVPVGLSYSIAKCIPVKLPKKGLKKGDENRKRREFCSSVCCIRYRNNIERNSRGIFRFKTQDN